MATSPKKSALKPNVLNSNTEISNALMHLNENFRLQNAMDDAQLKKAISNLVEIKNMKKAELKQELIEALCEIERINQRIEAYEVAVDRIRQVADSNSSKLIGGRPKNKWAVQAFNCAKKYLIEKNRLPSHEMLRRLVAKIAESNGEFGGSESDGVFSEDTAKQYLKYFKNNLPMFKNLDAEIWFKLYEGSYKLTKL